MFDPDPTSIRRTLSLFSPGILGARHTLTMGFESLGLEVGTRARVLQQSGLTAASLRDSPQLARLFAYASFRFRELLMRLEFLNWLQRQHQSIGNDYSPSWHNFAALAIKDFHVDLGSLMDAVAPVVLQASGAFDAAGEKKFPGFADVRATGGSDRALGFRRSIDAGVLNVIDSTTRWWPAIKRVRDDLAHREHEKIVFGEASQGIFFQLYVGMSPTIVDQRLLWLEAENVVDFRLYSAAVLSELLSFLEALGAALAGCLALSTKRLAPSMHVGDFAYLLDPLEQLLRSYEQAATRG